MSEKRKSYYEKYKNFWENVAVGLFLFITGSFTLGIIGWGVYSWIKFDIQLIKETGISSLLLVFSFLFCVGVLYYIYYFLSILIPKWLKNLDEERGIKFNE